MLHRLPPRLVHACTDVVAFARLQAAARSDKLACYLGVDPTAASLHVGHLIGVAAVRHLAGIGFTPVGLIGGATALIGDPSFRDKEREPLSPDIVARNATALEAQLKRLLGDECVMVNNAAWFSRMSAVELLKDVGTHFRVNAMQSREAVKHRDGLSFTELSYSMLQAYDFYVLHREHRVRVQVGGSDQWGNIVSGVELIHKLRGRGEDAVGLTVPLVTVGKRKLGKSAGNAVWLDASLTSDFALYQYFMRLDDDDARGIAGLFGDDEAWTKAELAAHVLAMARGDDAVARARKLTGLLYGEHTADTRAAVVAAAGEADEPPTRVEVGQLVAAAACKAGLCASNNEARRLEASGGLYLNGARVAKGCTLSEDDFEGGVALVRAGKSRWKVLKR